MISILIPVYNYNIQPLIENLRIQMVTTNCKWEILISEDASNEDLIRLNSEFVNKLNNSQIKLFQQEINIGNAANRNFLIEQASYEWLLFLDADILPVENNFITTYLKQMLSTSFEIITGNIVYDSKKPLPHLLRWKYGKEKEEVAFIDRGNNPILHCRAANFAIKRSLAKKVNFPILKEKYGFVDTRFFLQFNETEICVIENPVYHLGIEENSIFIEKTKKAIVNALFLLNSQDKLSKKITLISTYRKVRIFRGILAKVYSKFHLCFEKKLVSKKPSILVFQIYKLLYMSYLDVTKSTS